MPGAVSRISQPRLTSEGSPAAISESVQRPAEQRVSPLRVRFRQAEGNASGEMTVLWSR